MKKLILKCSVFSILCVTVLLFSGNIAYCAPPAINSFSCDPLVEITAWPKNTLKTTCNININLPSGGTTYKIGVYAANYNTVKNSGNGPTIDYRTPEDPVYRFQANGPYQAGTPANITTSSTGGTVTIVVNNITRTSPQDYSFDLLYNTFEADYGDTNYSQSVTVAVYKNNNAPLVTQTGSRSFTIRNRQIYSISAAPVVQLTSFADVFTLNQYHYSNTFTAYVAANNSWKLQTSLSGDLMAGSDSLPFNTNYFKSDGTGFDNLAPAYTNFTAANTYYDVAQNSAGEYTTGSVDGKNLSNKNITFSYAFKNTQPFKSGNYLTTTIFKLISP